MILYMKGVPGTTNVSWCNSDKSFRVTKWLNGKQKTLGSYPTLIGALMIRDWCQANNWKPYHRILSSSGEDYITIHNGAYEIHKRVNGKLKYFGRYHTLEDAKKWRDYFIENNWDINLNLDGSGVKNILLYNGKFQVRKKIEGHLYYFGCYDTLEEATRWRDYFKKQGWLESIILHERLLGSSCTHIRQSSSGSYYIVKTINGETDSYGTFKTYEEAADEVMKLRKSNWDWDTICDNLNELKDNREEWLTGKRHTNVIFEKYSNGRIDYDKNIF